MVGLVTTRGRKKMIVVMKPGATREEVKHVEERVEEMGLRSHIIHGTERTVIAAIGDKRRLSKETLMVCPGVDRVVPILAPYKVASREVHAETSVVNVAGMEIGGRKLAVIAGPCAVESKEQLLGIADAVKVAGAGALRGGAFKPRTNPYSFKGLGVEGLEYLAMARERTGLGVVTEVVTPDQVSLVARYADMLQVGARNMQNYLLLEAVGNQPKPVLLKRGFSATVDEFLFAAEYILSQGNPNVVLCERGIRTFEDHTRFTLSVATVPALKMRTHLPVIVDPSHAAGAGNLVPPLAKAAVAAGADGLIVEVHSNPEKALTDGAQSVTCEEFEQLMHDVARVAEAVDRTV
jgi:3-deoxy-7-phosphoheptulonate synthase